MMDTGLCIQMNYALQEQTVPKIEYSSKNHNMSADLAHLNEPTLAVLSAISKEKG